MKKFLLISFIVLLGLIKCYHAVGQAANVQDSLALVDVLQSIYGNNWINVLNINTASELSTWGMASLDNNGRIQVLSIIDDAQGMIGPISPSIGNLTALKGLEIGPVFSQSTLIGDIPSSIGNLVHLTSLQIINNNITGSIPSSIGNLVHLTSLQIYNNDNITGSIPSSIGNLINLTNLSLYNNDLTGDIPSSLGNLRHLNLLRFDGNQLSGTVPYFLGNVYNIYLDHNNFTFDGLEDFVKLYTFNFPNPGLWGYYPQANIPIHQHGYTLAVSAGGTLSNNTYQWTEISNNTSHTFTITGDSTFTPEEPGLYKVSVTNSIATGLTLSSGMPIKVTTVDPKFRSISGSVINPEIKDGDGGIFKNPISCTVTIYDAGTSTVEGSVTSSSDGTFKFTGLSNDNYDLIASYTAADGTSYSVVEHNVAVYSSDVQLEMPAGLIEDISNYNKTLSNLYAYLDDLKGSILLQRSYNVSPSSNFIRGQMNIIEDQGENIEALERLCMAERLLVKYYDQAATMNNQFVLSVGSLIKFLFNISVINLSGGESSSFFKSAIDWEKEKIIKGYIESLKNAVEAPINNMTSPYKAAYKTAIDLAFTQVEGGISLGDIYAVTLQPTVDKLLTNQTLQDIYISNTNYNLAYSVNNALYKNFSGDISNTASSLGSQLGASELKTVQDSVYAQVFRDTPDWIQFITHWSNEIMAVTKYKFWIVDMLGMGTDVINIGKISYSIHKSVKRENELVDEVNQIIPDAFTRKREDKWNLFNARIHADQLASLETIVKTFENKYGEVLSDISKTDTNDLYSMQSELIQLDGQINDSSLNLVNEIKAAIPFSTVTDSMYFNNLKYTLFGSPFIRYSHLSALLYYTQTFDDTLRDSIVNHFMDMENADSLMLVELGNMTTDLSNVSTPAYISVSKSNIPLNMLMNTDSTVTVRFKNYGSTATSGVYTKIQIDTPFTASVDSVYFGNLNAEQQDSLSFTIHAPIADTFSHYTIHFFANSAITNPLGGTIFSRSPSQPFTLPSSNFIVSASGATCVGSNDGAIKIIADSSLPYIAIVSNSSFDSSYSFTDSLAVNNLSAGTYQVCITVQGQQGYEQCYNLVINQPKPLSAYAVVNPSQHTITLNMDGGRVYYIQLGHQSYTTSNNEITLPLTSNEHLLMISTDKACQGLIIKHLHIPGEVMSYPNPFRDYLNIDFGKSNVANAVIKITELSTGRVVYDERVENQSGTIQLNTSDFGAGVYALDIYFDHVKYTFKIVKVEK